MMLFFLPLIPSLGNALSDACIHLQLVSALACLSLCILHENSLRSARPSFAIKHSQKLAETFTCVTFECEQGIHTAPKQMKKKKTGNSLTFAVYFYREIFAECIL